MTTTPNTDALLAACERFYVSWFGKATPADEVREFAGTLYRFVQSWQNDTRTPSPSASVAVGEDVQISKDKRDALVDEIMAIAERYRKDYTQEGILRTRLVMAIPYSTTPTHPRMTEEE